MLNKMNQSSVALVMKDNLVGSFVNQAYVLLLCYTVVLKFVIYINVIHTDV